MSTGRLLSTLEQLRETMRKGVLLYSGGLDSSYFLAWAAVQGLEVVPLRVDVGGGEPEPAPPPGAQVVRENRVAEFADEFVAPAIRANALHQGIFPVSSSLSRPLMARAAVRVAAQVGADCVVHTAEVHQNSRHRFNRSIRALAPHLHIGNPFVENVVSRQEKQQFLDRTEPPAYSVDANLWARVVENRELDLMTNPVGEHVFRWTARTTPPPDRAVTLTFAAGLPVALDGEPLPLADLIARLNAMAGPYGIGRFNGVEGTLSGIKNHEVREAPAAAVILAAHQQLEQVVLTDRELSCKQTLDRTWTATVVLGDWFSDLQDALAAFQTSIAAVVHGAVEVRLRPGAADVIAVHSAGDLTFGGAAADLPRRLSPQSMLEQETIDLDVRRGVRDRTMRSEQWTVPPSGSVPISTSAGSIIG